MRSCITLILAVLCTVAYAADPPLPPEAQAVVDKHDKAVEAAKKAYEAAVAKADAEAAKDLQKPLTAATKKGDLDSANAIKKKVDEYTLQAEAAQKLEGHALLTFLTVHPKWTCAPNKTFVFDAKQQQVHLLEGDKEVHVTAFSVEKFQVKFFDHVIDFADFDGKAATIKWGWGQSQPVTVGE